MLKIFECFWTDIKLHNYYYYGCVVILKIRLGDLTINMIIILPTSRRIIAFLITIQIMTFTQYRLRLHDSKDAKTLEDRPPCYTLLDYKISKQYLPGGLF